MGMCVTWQEADVLEEMDRAPSESATSPTDLRQERESPWLSGEEPAAGPRPGVVDVERVHAPLRDLEGQEACPGLQPVGTRAGI